LRQGLLRGEWPELLPSERKLCAQLGISRPTLRAVLQELEREGVVSHVQDRQRRVLQPVKRAAWAAEDTLIVLLTPVATQLMPPWVLSWVDALRELLAASGFRLEIHTAGACYRARPSRALKTIVERWRARVWVLFRSTAGMQQWFAEQQLPAVLAGSCAAGIALPSVDMDYRALCRHAAHLLVRRGHRRLALLLPEGSQGGDAESELGFLEARTASVEALVHRHSERPEAVTALLDRLLRVKSRPTAFLVARSTHTLTVVSHLLRERYQVPGELAILSRDDDAFLDHLVPRITRYSTDPATFAKRLAKLVLGLAQTGHTSSKPVRLMPELCQGETV
jgi:DNA-binding LacI/PurR family transcriptional regulator